jgi:phospholipase/carboxylesterase
VLAGDWLDEFLARHGLGSEQTVLGGFSQGGVMSYALGLGAGRPRPAGIMALSSFIPTVEGFELGDASGVPVAIGHGTYDPVIGVEFGRAARDRMTEAGAEVTYRESPMPHAIDPGFLPDLTEWVSGVAGTRA